MPWNSNETKRKPSENSSFTFHLEFSYRTDNMQNGTFDLVQFLMQNLLRYYFAETCQNIQKIQQHSNDFIAFVDINEYLRDNNLLCLDR